MTQEYLIRPTEWLIAPAHDPRIFHDSAYVVAIDDEGAGEFLNVRDMTSHQARQIAIDGDAWPALQTAITHAFAQIEQHARHDEHD